MKLPKIQTSKPFALATAVYLLLSLFGSALYLVLPPVLCSIGARSHAYLLIHAALEDNPTTMQILLMVVSQLYVFVLVVLGILAVLRGPSPAYCLLVALDILVTLIFLLIPMEEQFEHTAGILFNLVYCLWLLRILVPKKGRCNCHSSKKKGNVTHGKL